MKYPRKVWTWCLLMYFSQVKGDEVVVSYLNPTNVNSSGLLGTTFGSLGECFVIQNETMISQTRNTNFVAFTCVFAYETRTCSGRSLQLTFYDNDAKQLNFTARSFQPCKVGLRDPPRNRQRKLFFEAWDNHEFFRDLHGAPPLNLSRELCNSAQDISDRLSYREVFTRPSLTSFGMNIAYVSKSNEADSVHPAILAWYNQEETYHYTEPVFKVVQQHFTQLVWRTTKEFGIGVSWNERLQLFVVVSLYSPKGNIDGLYATNVYNIEPYEF